MSLDNLLLNLSLEGLKVGEIILHDLGLRIDLIENPSDLLLHLLVDDISPVGHQVVKHGLVEELLRVIGQPYQNFWLLNFLIWIALWL